MSFTRRSFLGCSGPVLGAGWLALNRFQIASAAMHAQAAVSYASARGFRVLSPAEARDVDAIAAQIVPTDDTPGAREAGAVYFIDRALSTFFAAHRDEFQSGYREFAAAAAAAHGGGPASQGGVMPRGDGLTSQAGAFADLQPGARIALLQRVEATPFFALVRFLTVLGLLADPRYGGNRGAVGWQLIGFQDEHVFEPPFGYYDRHYSGFVPYAKKPA